MKLVLFLGAGVSIPSGLPTVRKLTERLFVPTPADSDDTRRIRALLAVIMEHDTIDIERVGLVPTANGFQSSGAIYRSGGTTYEDLFYLCQEITLWQQGLTDNSLATPFMECIQEKAGDLLLGSCVDSRIFDLGCQGYRMSSYIEHVVTNTLRQKYIEGFDLIGELVTDRNVEQLNIVTLNHDTLVEQFLADKQVRFADGFGEPVGDVRWSDEKTYDDGSMRVRLFKLHGSIDWYSFRFSGGQRRAIFRGDDVASARDGAGRPLRAEYLRPSYLSGIQKANAYGRGIYADIHFHFSLLLRQCDRILMSGYGWGDTAINFKLDTWLDRSRSNRIVLLDEQPDDLTNRSLIFASGYDGWKRSGQLACVRSWLCKTKLSDVINLLREAK